MARYCFDESPGALFGYVATETEAEALDRYKAMLKDKELVCAMDGPTNGTR